MSVWNREEAKSHVGHKVEVVVYVGGESVTVECVICGTVLVAFEDLEATMAKRKGVRS